MRWWFQIFKCTTGFKLKLMQKLKPNMMHCRKQLKLPLLSPWDGAFVQGCCKLPMRWGLCNCPWDGAFCWLFNDFPSLLCVTLYSRYSFQSKLTLKWICRQNYYYCLSFVTFELWSNSSNWWLSYEGSDDYFMAASGMVILIIVWWLFLVVLVQL